MGNSLTYCNLLFQFHKGTIKTAELKTSYDRFNGFQFHKGTIKTRFLPVCVSNLLISIP